MHALTIKPKPTNNQLALIRLRYPRTGELRIGIIQGTLTGHRHTIRTVECGCGTVVLARRQRHKVRGYLSVPSARLFVEDVPTCEACYKYAANASARVNAETEAVGGMAMLAMG
jgi:hypothetical protein